jgi:NTE family protein
MKKEINTLIFSGGGVKGIAYIGVLKYLDEICKKRSIVEQSDNFNDEQSEIPKINIKTVCGVSIGSIIGLLYVLGYTFDDLIEELNELDLPQLKNFKIKNIFTEYGFDKGLKVSNWIESLILKKGYSKKITFKQLYNIKGINLQVLASNVNKYTYTIFDTINTPDLKIKDAIRMSISIPFLFTIKEYNNDIHVDGALINNYPIKLFKDNLDNVLGFKLMSNGELESHNIDVKIDCLEDYIYNIMKCFIVQKEKETTLSYIYKDHTICIEAEDVTHILNFELTLNEKDNLINIGYESTRKYFELN